MALDYKDFELILLPGKKCPAAYLSYYEKAYHCWKETWETAFKHEMNHEQKLFSDPFTRQDEILAVFYKGICMGVTFFRWVDFSIESTLHDSYFEHWPSAALDALRRDGDRIVIISQFTLNLKTPKSLEGISARDLLI